MTYDNAELEAMAIFEGLSFEEQKEIILSYYEEHGGIARIYPMVCFNAFCEQEWEGDYETVAKTVCRSKEKNAASFDFDDAYFMFDYTLGVFVSARYLPDLVEKREWICWNCVGEKKYPVDFMLYVMVRIATHPGVKCSFKVVKKSTK